MARVMLGAELWPGSSVVTYSYIDLQPCFWNDQGQLKVSNDTGSCGGCLPRLIFSTLDLSKPFLAREYAYR
jgi:hypothetical protein